MEEIESRVINHNGREFVLKLFRADSGFSVVAFLGTHQASPSYSVNLETYMDYFMQHRERLTDNLFSIAQSDIEHGLYFHA